MALITLRQLLDHAAENGYGLPAFNVNNMEQVKAIMEADAAADSPVILQGSAGARSYARGPFLRHPIPGALEKYRETQRAAIGTWLGPYKSTQKPTGKLLIIHRKKENHQGIPNVHLVIHGSSS